MRTKDSRTFAAAVDFPRPFSVSMECSSLALEHLRPWSQAARAGAYFVVFVGGFCSAKGPIDFLPERAVASSGICLCEEPPAHSAGAATVAASVADLRVGTTEACKNVGATEMASVSLLSGIRGMHFLSAATICFARAVNDTPKLAALLLAAKATGVEFSFWIIAAAMAIGGLLNGRRVAETMSKKLVPLAHEQGLIANLVTNSLVPSASSFGLPVSTTHVSVGSISGTGFVTGKLDRGELGKIVLSWAITLPLAASLAAGTALLIQ